ncbi:MAG: DUF2062 domain-containing protein [Betaproteobacteria bacterium]|nr:DUF2062 domain-containing protein [Betaproteobacteria bacterium]
MRKRIRKIFPDHESVRGNRWLAPFENTLLHPRLWHLNRRSAAGAVAAGMFCGLIPGPLQMLGAAICAVVFRVNLPLAMLTTLYTNPFTIVPLYILAFTIGSWTLPGSRHHFVAPPEPGEEGLLVWAQQIIDWMIGLGAPLALGLVLLALGLALASYVLIRVAWRFYLVRAWHHRRQRHLAAARSRPGNTP